MNRGDIDYIAMTIANMARVPVRIYEDGARTFTHDPSALPQDPIVPVEEQVCSIRDEVGYFVTEGYFVYGVVNSEDLQLVVGPIREGGLNDKDLRELALSCSVPPEDFDRFSSGMRTIGDIPFYTLLQILCAMDFVMNGKRISADEVIIRSHVQDDITRRFAEESFSRNEFRDIAAIEHSTENIEQTMCDLIRLGRPRELKAYLKTIPSYRSGKLSPDVLRHEKNTFIATATLVSRAAIRGGMDIEEALFLSDVYINRCEQLASLEAIHDLSYHMVLEYAEKVEQLRIGDDPSPLVLGVANYVRSHLYEPIRTEDVAKALFVSRGFLSTRFKEETGKNLADYIQEEKVAEAKHLLRHTGQSLLSISTYLGYCSQSHFNTVFKRYVGCTPREYRNRM